MSLSPQPPSRRRFVNWLLGTSVGALVAAIVYPIVRYLNPPEISEASASEVEAGLTTDAVWNDKGFVIVRFGGDPVIVLRAAQDDFRAFSAVCTHLSCIVEFRQQEHDIFCNCHHGEYNLHGEVISGPPPRPLKPYPVKLVAAQGAPGAQRIVVTRG